MKIVLTCSNVLFIFIYRKAKGKLDDKPVTPAVPPVPPPTQTLPKQRPPQVPEPGTPMGDNPLAPQKLHFGTPNSGSISPASSHSSQITPKGRGRGCGRLRKVAEPPTYEDFPVGASNEEIQKYLNAKKHNGGDTRNCWVQRLQNTGKKKMKESASFTTKRRQQLERMALTTSKTMTKGQRNWAG